MGPFAKVFDGEKEREIVGECWNLGPVLVAFLDRLCLVK